MHGMPMRSLPQGMKLQLWNARTEKATLLAVKSFPTISFYHFVTSGNGSLNCHIPVWIPKRKIRGSQFELLVQEIPSLRKLLFDCKAFLFLALKMGMASLWTPFLIWMHHCTRWPSRPLTTPRTTPTRPSATGRSRCPPKRRCTFGVRTLTFARETSSG